MKLQELHIRKTNIVNPVPICDHTTCDLFADFTASVYMVVEGDERVYSYRVCPQHLKFLLKEVRKAVHCKPNVIAKLNQTLSKRGEVK